MIPTTRSSAKSDSPTAANAAQFDEEEASPPIALVETMVDGSPNAAGPSSSGMTKVTVFTLLRNYLE